MPYNPAGLFSLVASYFASPGASIRTEQHNPVFEDVASALSNVVVRDGRAPMTGPLNMNGFPINNAVAGSTSTSVATLAQAAPIGAVIDFCGITAPSGWALCYGQTISRTTYAALFAIIGTTFGVGDGTTTFNVPDLRGRVTAGLDAMGGTSSSRISTLFGSTSIGSAGGEQVHTLTTPEIASHTHTGTTGVNNIGHNHGYTLSNAINVSVGSTGTGVNSGVTPANTAGESNAHQHPFTTDSAGGGGSHNNLQPMMVLSKIIRISYDV